jgi:hypothetical protein
MVPKIGSTLPPCVLPLLALTLLIGCAADGEVAKSPPPETITEPIPPPGLFADLPKSERQIKLQQLYRGTPIEELPDEERSGVINSNRREVERSHSRDEIKAFASAQSKKATAAATSREVAP